MSSERGELQKWWTLPGFLFMRVHKASFCVLVTYLDLTAEDKF